jgi:EAL domain-containing protein (putative c-di-GMP-specific phosphodiesterase class I)
VYAERMRDVFGDRHMARLAGEGVVLLLPDLTVAASVDLAQQAVRIMSAPIEAHGMPFRLDCAAGVVISPDEGRDINTLLIKAALATARAHREDRQVVLFASEAAALTSRKAELISELYATLRDPRRHDEIALHYQPQLELDTGLLAGAEALVRWTHPRWGTVPPDEFCEAAESSEVIHVLTRHVISIAAAQMREWNDRGFPVRVAVNASAKDLGDRAFTENVGAALSAHGVPPTQLVIEITERTFLTDNDRVARVADRLVSTGVALSIDDFGTGYASMQRLGSLPLSEVKMDQSYVNKMLTDHAACAIVVSVHQLCHALGLTFVAEGIEDERTANALARLPGTVGQGWYHGRPLPPAAFYDRWHRHTRLRHANQPPA